MGPSNSDVIESATAAENVTSSSPVSSRGGLATWDEERGVTIDFIDPGFGRVLAPAGRGEVSIVASLNQSQREA